MAGISLARLCLESVAENIALCCKDVTLNDGLIYPHVAFSQLSDRAIQEILDIAFSKEILSPEYFALLIHQNVLRLDLSRYHDLITDQVLLQLHCKKLVSLNLQYCNQPSSKCLNQMLQNLTCLTCINLSQCFGCLDSVLENIAKYCPNLKDLNLESCSGITDHGIESLLKPSGSSSEPLKILYLNVSSTSVTTKSLLILLSRLPLLLSLSFAGLGGTTEEFVAGCMFIMKHKIAPFQLQHLDMLGTLLFDHQMNLLDVILESCSNLIELKLSLPLYTKAKGYPELFSKSLKHLSKLKTFHISGSASGILCSQKDFPLPLVFEQIEHFLKEIGHQLESLNLARVQSVNLSVLCLYCNSLKKLVLSDCQLVQPFLPRVETSPKEHSKLANTGCDITKFSDFCSLQYIDLENIDFKDVSLDLKQKLLYQLLTSHLNLLQLSLKTVPIEEECLIKILRSSSGFQLKELVLSCFDNITVKTIRMIEESCPNLKRLEVFHCWVITWTDIWQINDRLKTNGRKLEIVVPDQNDLI